MGYFSNGTEALDYQLWNCDRCQNWRDRDDGRGDGCAIFDAHTLYNADQHKNTGIKDVLEELIPSTATGNKQCAVFLERTDASVDVRSVWAGQREFDAWVAGVQAWRS